MELGPEEIKKRDKEWQEVKVMVQEAKVKEFEQKKIERNEQLQVDATNV